jgi:hypothetical protein
MCGKLKGKIGEIKEAQKRVCDFLGKVRSELLEEVAEHYLRDSAKTMKHVQPSE